MTETEELQKNTLESWRQARMKDLIAHLQLLSDNIDKNMKRGRIGSIIFFATWSIWVSGPLWDYLFHTDRLFGQLGFLIFVFGLSYQHHTSRELYRALGEYLSAIKVLEILGVIDPMPPRGVKNKRKRISFFVDLVKKWAIQKKKAQEEVYQPA